MEKAKGQGIPVRSSFGHHETGRSEVARQNNLLIFIWLSEPIWYLYFRQINRDLKTEILRQRSVLSLRGRPARSRIFSCLLSMPSAVFASSVFGHKCSYSEGKTSRREGALQAQTDAPLKQADERRPSSTSEFSFAKGRPVSLSNYVLRSRGVHEVLSMATCTEEVAVGAKAVAGRAPLSGFCTPCPGDAGWGRLPLGCLWPDVRCTRTPCTCRLGLEDEASRPEGLGQRNRVVSRSRGGRSETKLSAARLF